MGTACHCGIPTEVPSLTGERRLPRQAMDPARETVHALSIDVEGFAESHAQSVTVDPALLEPTVSDREIERNLGTTLEVLSECNRKATFFFLGRVAQTAPRLVRRVADAGHEVGCHSMYHRRITGQTPVVFRTEVTEAKRRLEDASGQEVIGFRAPDFSIGAGNLWAFDDLATAGFRYDSSVVPTGLHDVYGMTDIPCDVFRWPNGLIEFPLPVIHVLGAQIPIGGGGYFRLFPLRLTTSFYRRQSRRNRPAAFYIHPYEIGAVAPRLMGLSFVRRFRHYVHLSQGGRRFGRLLRSVAFGTMASVLGDLGFLQDHEPGGHPA